MDVVKMSCYPGRYYPGLIDVVLNVRYYPDPVDEED